MTKSQRVEIAREREQARAAAADRPTTPAPCAPIGTASARGRAPEPDVDRRRRREAAVAGDTIEAPPRLGDEVRRRNLFLLPPEDERDEAAQ
jgi:hypothetical protein